MLNFVFSHRRHGQIFLVQFCYQTRLIKYFVIPAKAGTQYRYGVSVGYKSFQYGFFSSISFSFQSRFHFLIRFSRVIALSAVSCCSHQTSLSTPCSLVKPPTNFSRLVSRLLPKLFLHLGQLHAPIQHPNLFPLPNLHL